MADVTGNAPGPRAIPEGYRTLTAGLVVDNAAAAIEFYKRAFGAQELYRMPSPDGKGIWHAEIQIGDSRLMVNDEFPEMDANRAPKSLGGTTASVHLYVEDADAAFQRAVDAGANVAMPLGDTFWGDRYGQVTDPFGHLWGIATHVEDVSPEEMQLRAQAFASAPV
jgi:PhnB protein